MMNGTPQPDRNKLPALGTKHRILNHEAQPLTIELLTPCFSILIPVRTCTFKYFSSTQIWSSKLIVSYLFSTQF